MNIKKTSRAGDSTYGEKRYFAVENMNVALLLQFSLRQNRNTIQQNEIEANSHFSSLQ